MVVRSTADPSTTPNSNGIYAVGNFVAGTEKVVYLGTNKSFTDLGLSASTQYYYRIYTVDKACNYSTTVVSVNGSTTAPSFAAEPSSQASGITFSSVSSTGMTINWTAGDGANSLMVVKEGSAVNANPGDGDTLAPNTAFGSGTQLGTGNYAVYNSIGNSVSITGLLKARTYYVKVYTFNGSAGSENYLTSSPASGNQVTVPGEIVSTGLNTVSTSYSSGAAWVGGIVPTQYDNVTIAANDIINLGSTQKCYNLTVNSGGKIVATTSQVLQVYGTSLSCAGTLGDPLASASLLTLEFGGNLTISGSGTIAPYRIRPVTALSNVSVTIDAPTTTVTYGVAGISVDNTGNDNVTFTNVLGNFTTNSSATGLGAGSATLNVYGTLNITNTFNNTVATGKTYALTVYNGGLISTGRFNLSAAHQVQASTATVNFGGEIKVNGTSSTAVDCSHPTITSAVVGGGTFSTTSSVGLGVALGNASGLDITTGPIRTTTRNFNVNNNFSFVGTAAQVSGSDFPATVNSLTINNVAGVTLTSATSMTGKLTLTSGLLSTGGLLTLKSGDCCTSAVVSTVTGGSVTGNVIVERNIPAGFRAYRLLSPATTGGTIKANWQEN
jgi:hypothetical protein